jgi:hypothetical protein
MRQTGVRQDVGRVGRHIPSEKLEPDVPTPKGAFDFERVAASLKRYADTNRVFQ